MARRRHSTESGQPDGEWESGTVARATRQRGEPNLGRWGGGSHQRWLLHGGAFRQWGGGVGRPKLIRGPPVDSS
jgi:hypothetical protein